jgi:tetratricopeptide (TPR) repeat protein
MAGEDLSFTLAWADIDPEVLPADAREAGTEAFRREVTAFLGRAYESVGGKVRIVFDDAQRLVDVHWAAPSDIASLERKAREALNRLDLANAVPLLKALIAKAPGNPTHLYSLGTAYSDQGRLDDAKALLAQVLAKAPDHLDSLVALGVVHARAGDLYAAVRTLRHAVRLAPENTCAQQNLGACLLKQGHAEKAVEHFRASLRVEPANTQAQLGLAQALETAGDLHEADEAYQTVLRAASHEQMAELAKEGRTRIAHALLRRAGDERPDVVMYCLGALRRFEAMTEKQVEAIGHEIAILGMKGLDINDPDQKYTLKSLPGNFSGLHLLSLMYVAFKQLKPEADVGVDFSSEYARARKLHYPGGS